jgi:heat shock protein HslJ
MYCDDVQSIENEFFRQLGKVTGYEIKGKTLLLFDGDNPVLEFEAG